MTMTEKIQNIKDIEARNNRLFSEWNVIQKLLSKLSFFNLVDDTVVTLNDVFDEWFKYRKLDPDNHADLFMAELFNILMDTINGRNDMEIVGLTNEETDTLIRKLFWCVM